MSKKTPAAEIVSFPVWEEIISGYVLRSALFAVIQKGQRKALTRAEIASVPGMQILFTGIQFDQPDLDVYLQCLRLALANGSLSTPILISEKAFLKALGRTYGKSSRMWLAKSLSRLHKGHLRVRMYMRQGIIDYSGRLILEFRRHKTERQHLGKNLIRIHPRKKLVRINPLLTFMFSRGLWTDADWEVRKALRGHPLALWLHAFYRTYNTPYPYDVARLKELCGSGTKHLGSFRQRLKQAIEQVASATGWRLWIDEHDCLRVERQSLLPKDGGDTPGG